MLIAWVSSQGFAHNARSVRVRVGRRQQYATDIETEKKPLSFSPWNGTYFFFHRGHLCWFRSIQKDVGYRSEELLSISCLGRSSGVVKELFSHCRTEYLKMNENKTAIFEPRDNCWKSVMTRSVRPISTVIMNENDKATMMKDIETYLNPRSRRWYSNRGFPYRKGYLLYGPPGTGKSSLSLSIAGHFGLDIYKLNISSISGESLSDLFAELPPHCVLLLEDVDAVHMTQSRQVEETDPTKENSTQRPKGKISLSDLLNALDGVSSHEGRLLIMTTNHIAHLDAALIRAGRADMKIELPYANKDVIARLFRMVFKPLKDDTSDATELADDEDTIEWLTNEFVEKVSEGEFSPAEIQSFLVENRESPRMAVENVEHWMRRTRQEKAKRADGINETEILTDPPNLTPPDSSVEELQPVTMDQVKTQIKNVLHEEMLFGVIGPRPLWSILDDPDAACCHKKLLITAVEKLRAIKAVANTPPPSESGESAGESSQPEFGRGGGNAMRPRFLDVVTAVEISAYSNDAYSETTSDVDSSGTSFEGESELYLGTEASVMEKGDYWLRNA